MVSPRSATAKLLRVKNDMISPAIWLAAFSASPSPTNVFFTICEPQTNTRITSLNPLQFTPHATPLPLTSPTVLSATTLPGLRLRTAPEMCSSSPESTRCFPTLSTRIHAGPTLQPSTAFQHHRNRIFFVLFLLLLWGPNTKCLVVEANTSDPLQLPRPWQQDRFSFLFYFINTFTLISFY